MDTPLYYAISFAVFALFVGPGVVTEIMGWLRMARVAVRDGQLVVYRPLGEVTRLAPDDTYGLDVEGYDELWFDVPRLRLYLILPRLEVEISGEDFAPACAWFEACGWDIDGADERRKRIGDRVYATRKPMSAPDHSAILRLKDEL